MGDGCGVTMATMEAFLEACKAGCLEDVKSIAAEIGEEVRRSGADRNPLLQACRGGNVFVLKHLIRHVGVDVCQV